MKGFLCTKLVKTMKMAFFEIKDWEKVYLQEKIKEHTLEFIQEPLSTSNVNKYDGHDVV